MDRMNTMILMQYPQISTKETGKAIYYCVLWNTFINIMKNNNHIFHMDFSIQKTHLKFEHKDKENGWRLKSVTQHARIYAQSYTYIYVNFVG